MSIKILESQWLLDWASSISGFEVEGFTILPGIVVTGKKPKKTTIRHEMIHQKQMEEQGVVKFCFLYNYYYLKNRFYRGMSKGRAYRYNPLEMEAYRLEKKRT